MRLTVKGANATVVRNFFSWVLALAALLAVDATLVPERASADKARPTLVPALPAPPPDRPTLVVLGYHQFAPEADLNPAPAPTRGAKKKRTHRDITYFLSPEELAWEFQWIKDHGWTVVTLDQVLAHYEKGTPIPAKSVLLTYDDGYRSVFTQAFPVIKRFKVPGVLFIYSDFIQWPSREAFRHGDLLEMAKAGQSLQSHSKSHPNMGLMKDRLAPAALAAALKDEMETSRDYLRDQLGSHVTALAYPFGVYNFEAVEAARAAGYRLAFTVNPGANDSTTDPMRLHRYLVVHGTSHEKFASFFDRKPLHVAKVEPADGEVVDTRSPVFSAKILDEVDPSSVRMFLGDRPLNRVQFKPATGRVTRPLHIQLPRGGHMATIVATDKSGTVRSYTWYFRIRKTGKPSPSAKTAERHLTGPDAPAPAPGGKR